MLPQHEVCSDANTRRPPARPHGMEAHVTVLEERERRSDLALLVRAERVAHERMRSEATALALAGAQR